MQKGLLAGTSREQQEAEVVLISGLSQKLRVPLCKKRIALSGPGSLEIDGYCESPRILCEAWAHVGPPRSAQRNKVMSDALKLLYAARMLGDHARRILVFSDEEAARPFRANGWIGHCLRAYQIETAVIDLPPAMRDAVRKAQDRQYR